MSESLKLLWKASPVSLHSGLPPKRKHVGSQGSPPTQTDSLSVSAAQGAIIVSYSCLLFSDISP